MTNTMEMVRVAMTGIGAIAVIAGTYKAFEKAGEKGWKAIIPFYNEYTQFKLTWNTRMFWIALLAAFITAVTSKVAPVLPAGATLATVAVGLPAAITTLVLLIKAKMRIAKAYGHGTAFGLGLLFLEPIFTMILGFGKSEYVGA